MSIRGFDGFQQCSERPGVSLVCFGRIEQDLEETLMDSLVRFFDSFQDCLPLKPEISCIHEHDPTGIPAINQQRAYFPQLEQAGGNIVLGITNTGFYDRSLGRYIFSYGQGNGRGILSTLRFRNESVTSGQFRERMGKQLLKTLALACTMGSCSDARCIVSYHRWAKDLDRNCYICEPCRKEFARNLAFFLDVPADSGSPRLPGR